MPNPLQDALGEPPLTSKAPGIVLDTNVVLDWLLFEEPSVAALARALAAGDVRWLATAVMRQELAHVLERGLALRRGGGVSEVLAAFDRHATILPPAPTATALRCTDADDQKFIDLAVTAGAHWLLSRDRAVLKLRSRAARVGLAILKPEAWPSVGDT